MSLSLIDLMVLLGIAAVLPLALGGRWWGWAVAATAALAAFLLPRGPAAALLALPWVAVCVAALAAALRRAGPRPAAWRLAETARVVACAYAAVAAGALVQSRRGATLFGIGEPIVELTAVHYTYAGAGALALAAGMLARSAGRARGVARAAVVLTAIAPPVVAAGFIVRAALLQVGGAVLMTLGVWLTGALHLRAAARKDDAPAARGLLAVSGLAIWVPMVLAVSWAAGQHWGFPALPIPDMVRTHGLANALGFTLCGLLGQRLSRRSSDNSLSHAEEQSRQRNPPPR